MHTNQYTETDFKVPLAIARGSNERSASSIGIAIAWEALTSSTASWKTLSMLEMKVNWMLCENAKRTTETTDWLKQDKGDGVQSLKKDRSREEARHLHDYHFTRFAREACISEDCQKGVIAQDSMS